jgi:hypothetical protein
MAASLFPAVRGRALHHGRGLPPRRITPLRSARGRSPPAAFAGGSTIPSHKKAQEVTKIIPAIPFLFSCVFVPLRGQPLPDSSRPPHQRLQRFIATKRHKKSQKNSVNPIHFFAHFRASSWPTLLDSSRLLRRLAHRPHLHRPIINAHTPRIRFAVLGGR